MTLRRVWCIAGLALTVIGFEALGQASAKHGRAQMQTFDLWTLVDHLPTKMPLDQDKLQTLLGVVLHEKGSNAYNDMYEGGLCT